MARTGAGPFSSGSGGPVGPPGPRPGPPGGYHADGPARTTSWANRNYLRAHPVGSNVLSPTGAARTKKPKLQKTLSKQAQDEVWDVKAMVSRRHAPPTRLRGAQRRLVTDGRRGWDRFARTRVSSWS